MTASPTVMARARHRRDVDQGSGEVLGILLFAPVMIGLAVLVLFLGRQVDSRSQVQAASDAAAAAAALQRDPGAAQSAARRTATLMLQDSAACAGGARVSVAADHWAPGGRVTVTVTCSPRRSDLGLIALPPRRLVGTGSASIDPGRAPALP